MTLEEGWRNFSEMEDTIPKEHRVEVEEMLWDNWISTRSHTQEDVSWRESDLRDEDWYYDHGQGD